MTCPQCSTENPAAAKFCCGCGTPFARKCPHCGGEVMPSAKFCHECGASLAIAPRTAPSPPPPPKEEAAPPPPAPQQAVTPTSAERRQLTVVFTDLVSFTQLSERLDPEDLNTVVHDYYNVCQVVCKRYDGRVANYLGDGVLMMFGYPSAHEDDAARATRTALAIVEGVEGLNARLGGEIAGIKLQVRAGVHTGLMVVGDERAGNWEQMALGETLNIAARVQSVGSPGSVVVSASTHRIVQGFFACRSLGVHTLKGVSQPMELHEITHETTARGRLEAAGRGGLTPLTGREREVETLLDLWEQAFSRGARTIVLSGEAGIGKSRLVQMLKQHVAQVPGTWLTPCQCSPYHQSTALFPYADLLERVVLKLDRRDSAQDRLAKLRGMLVQYSLDLDQILPLFAALLSIPPSGGYTPASMDPQEQRRLIMEGLLQILRERARKQPLLFVVEDLHWMDPSSLELLRWVVSRLREEHILSLFTCRPEFESPWLDDPNVSHLEIRRLDPGQVRTICVRVAHGKKLPEEIIEQIIERTDGVPLFVEELTKMVLESGLLEDRGEEYVLNGPLPPLAIPSTLQDSLMARLDRMSTVKTIAQIGAVIGREFSHELLRRVHPLDTAALDFGLLQLVEAELLFQEGSTPDATFTFKHALVQEAAYQSLVKSRRQQHHRAIAQALEEHFPQTAVAEPEVLAHHYMEAGLAWQAVPYLLKAGERAAERSAHAEAIAHLNRAQALLKTLPDGPGRWQLEITTLITLGASLTATKGYGVREVEQTYSRARDLSEQCGTAGQLFQARYGLWRLHMLRAEYDIATRQGEELLDLARRQDNAAFLVAAHRSLGATLFYRGRFSDSRQHAESVIAATAQEESGRNTLIRDIFDVVDPRVTCRSYLSWNLWMQGFPGRARQESAAAIALAEELQHPFSIALALSFGTWLEQFLGDARRVSDLASQSIEHCRKHGFPFWIGWNQVMLGWASAHDGSTSGRAATMIHKGLSYWGEKGSNLGRGYFLCLAAETHMRFREWSAALDALSQAQAFSDETDERYWEPERHRLNGELLLSRGSPHEQSETCFLQAIENAKARGALSLELRAATSLARLWRAMKKTQAAKECLAALLHDFPDTSETSDLRDAKRTLAIL